MSAFALAHPRVVAEAYAELPPEAATPSEIAEIQAKCDSGAAGCLTNEDGIVVIELRALATTLELFVWLALASKHGAFIRQLPALLSIASELGASTLAFQSTRRGWARRLGPEWAHRGANEFVRSVQ